MDKDKKIVFKELAEELPEVIEMIPEEKKPIPKHLQKYSDPEHRKAWMRKYHKNYYHVKLKPNKPVKRSKKVVETKKNDSMNSELSKSGIGQVINVVKDMIGDPEDPVVKAIDKYSKYVPLVTGFLNGFMARAKEVQAQKGSVKPNQKIKSPDGWNSFSAMQKLNKKYDSQGNITKWYKQGLAFDSGDSDEEFAGVSETPVGMKQTVHGSGHDHRTMADMTRESNKMVGEAVGSSMGDVPLVERKDDSPVNIDDALKKKGVVLDVVVKDNVAYSGDSSVPLGPCYEAKEEPKSASESLDPKVKDQIIDVVAGEVNMYSDLVFNYFKNRSMKDFENDVLNAEEIVNKFMSGMGRLLPFQAKDLIRSTSFEDLYTMVGEADPSKIELLTSKNLKGEFRKMWEGIQNKIK